MEKRIRVLETRIARIRRTLARLRALVDRWIDASTELCELRLERRAEDEGEPTRPRTQEASTRTDPAMSSATRRARWALGAFLLVSVPSFGDIVVEGIEDKNVYPDKVSLRVVSAPGTETTAALRGEPIPVERSIPVDAFVEVSEPKEYYELTVSRKDLASGATETAAVRFIVRASERANTEWGIPPWTPHPPIPSAAAEFSGSSLVLVAPGRFPTGLEIPIAAFVRDGGGNRVGVNGLVRAAGYEDRAIRIFRGVGSGTLPPAAGAGTISYAARIQTIEAFKDIEIEPVAGWTETPGEISASADWGEDARIRVARDIAVAAGATWTIRAGSVVLLAPGADIEVNGSLVVRGTPDRPVVFTAESRETPWGGLLFRTSASRGDISWAMFLRSGANPRWFDDVSGSGYSHRREQALVYLSNGARVTMADSCLLDGAGQAAHGENSDLTLERCLVQKFTTGGQFNGGTLAFTHCAFIEFPSADAPFADADNDALYLGAGTRTLTNCLFGWTLDDGVDGGGGATGPMYIRGCWFESTYHEGFALTDEGSREFRDCVAVDCGQGFECGYDAPRGDIERCLLTANGVGARFGDNYDWTYRGFLKVADSLLLFNGKDVWGRAWDDWSQHLSQMDIRDNWLSAGDPLHPENAVWDPVADAARLAPFLPTPATEVGIGIALRDPRIEISRLREGVPVRLSTFSAAPVAVGYSVATDAGPVEEGTLLFAPGESLKLLRPPVPDLAVRRWVRVRLADPVRGELTGLAEALYARFPRAALIARGSRWKYWDKGTDLGTAWRSPEFDDSSWREGPAELGAGDGDEATRIDIGPEGARFPTVYFRSSFEVEDPSRIASLEVHMKRDDGAVVYLNGEERLRQNMPAGPASYATWAASVMSGSSENAFYSDGIGASSLVAGRNVLAVEVHQSDPGSSDLSFDLELVAVGFPELPGSFVRGDANSDSEVDVSDAVKVLLVLFAGAGASCEDALDANDDGAASIADAIYILQFLFRRGPPPPAPFPGAAEDPTGDALACE